MGKRAKVGGQIGVQVREERSIVGPQGMVTYQLQFNIVSAIRKSPIMSWWAR